MYSYDAITRVWFNPANPPISYSDGDKTEQRIAKAIAESNDVSVLSPELPVHCIDWPSTYHLSPNRCNLLRPLAHVLKGKTLEIGAGCGVLTRYLGELGGDVTAIEGSMRRATITASRTRDLTNVKVICSNFQDFEPTELFDAVTLIGVLEYAQVYLTGVEDPVLHVLELAKRCLKPGGVLLVAIENQLGLKYFAGIPEDHVNKRFFGIQGFYSETSPITFGRRVLEATLKRAGFAGVECATPFPDYKFADCVLLPAGLADDSFDSSALTELSLLRDPQIHNPPLFSLPRTSHILKQNGLLADFANSFLMIASIDGATVCPSDTLAYHFSVNIRQAAFCKQAVFIKTAADQREIHRTRLDTTRTLPIDLGEFSFNPPAMEAYQPGQMLAKRFSRIVTTPAWHMSDVGMFLKEYISAIKTIAGEKYFVAGTRLSTIIPGALLDAIPANIIEVAPAEYVLIDQEWQAKADISLGLLLFRSLSCLLNTVRFLAEPKNRTWLKKKAFFHAAFAAAGLSVTDQDLQAYWQVEIEFRRCISTRKVTKTFSSWATKPLPVYQQNSAYNSFSKACGHAVTLLNHKVKRRFKKIRRSLTR